MSDCDHWIPFLLEAEREERMKLERENRELRGKLASIDDMVRDVRRPGQAGQEAALHRQALGSARPSGGVLGGGWPWC